MAMGIILHTTEQLNPERGIGGDGFESTLSSGRPEDYLYRSDPALTALVPIPEGIPRNALIPINVPYIHSSELWPLLF